MLWGIYTLGLSFLPSIQPKISKSWKKFRALTQIENTLKGTEDTNHWSGLILSSFITGHQKKALSMIAPWCQYHVSRSESKSSYCNGFLHSITMVFHKLVQVKISKQTVWWYNLYSQHWSALGCQHASLQLRLSLTDQVSASQSAWSKRPGTPVHQAFSVSLVDLERASVYKKIPSSVETHRHTQGIQIKYQYVTKIQSTYNSTNSFRVTSLCYLGSLL